jgi:hypothetical protein
MALDLLPKLYNCQVALVVSTPVKDNSPFVLWCIRPDVAMMAIIDVSESSVTNVSSWESLNAVRYCDFAFNGSC